MRFDFPVIPLQLGLATNRQLLAAGWTRAAINTLSSVRGEQVLPRVYSQRPGPLTDAQRRVAGWLWAGSTSVLTGGWGLVSHGLDVRHPASMTFLVPPHKRNRAAGHVRTSRTQVAPASRVIDGVPVASVARCLVDAGRCFEGTTEWVRATTIAALQNRMTTIERVEAELAGGRANGTRGVRLGISDFGAGAWSLPEVELERVLSVHRRNYEFLANPTLLTPEDVFIGVPDGYLIRYGIALQVHSRAHHSGRDDAGRDRWAITVEHDGAYAEHDIAVVPVAPSTLSTDPQRFLRHLDAVVAVRRSKAAPRIQVIPRTDPRHVASKRDKATL